MSEFQIMNVVHEMLIYATACKANNNDDKSCVIMIISGFTETLKSWWDNYLTINQKNKILCAVKIEANAQGQPVSVTDVVYTLVQTIIYHFIGSGSNNDESQRYLIQNLKCLSLAHYRWYKAIFLTKIMLRGYANSIY